MHLFLQQVYEHLGKKFAKTLHTDNGLEFLADAVKECCDEKGVKMARGLPWTPRSQGQVCGACLLFSDPEVDRALQPDHPGDVEQAGRAGQSVEQSAGQDQRRV